MTFRYFRVRSKRQVFHFQKRVVVVYWKAQGENRYEIFHQEPLCAAADGRAGPLRPGSTVSLKEISERQQLSLKYLEQIVTPLARVGLVKSERGSQGGYRLTKAPADYTAGEILRAIEGQRCPHPLPRQRDQRVSHV